MSLATHLVTLVIHDLHYKTRIILFHTYSVLEMHVFIFFKWSVGHRFIPVIIHVLGTGFYSGSVQTKYAIGWTVIGVSLWQRAVGKVYYMHDDNHMDE